MIHIISKIIYIYIYINIISFNNFLIELILIKGTKLI